MNPRISGAAAFLGQSSPKDCKLGELASVKPHTSYPRHSAGCTVPNSSLREALLTPNCGLRPPAPSYLSPINSKLKKREPAERGGHFSAHA